MLRVIQQEETRAIAESQFHLHGFGRKHEKFSQFIRRAGYQLITPEPAEVRAVEAQRTVDQVRQKLGRFYRPPRIKA